MGTIGVISQCWSHRTLIEAETKGANRLPDQEAKSRRLPPQEQGSRIFRQPKYHLLSKTIMARRHVLAVYEMDSKWARLLDQEYGSNSETCHI